MTSSPVRLSRRMMLSLGALSSGLGTLSSALGQPAASVPATSPAAGVGREQVVIGQVISLEGGRNDYGVAVRQGVETALVHINANGGVQGRRLVLKVLDDNAKAAESEAAARQLVEQQVFMLFGTIEGGPCNAVMKVANETGVPFFGPMAGSPTLRRPHQPLVFPVRAEHREEFRALLTHARSLGMRRVGFLQSDSEVGRLHLENVRLIASPLGMEVVLPMPISGDIKDDALLAYARKLRDQRAEVVFNHGSSGIYERLIKIARNNGVNTTFYGINSGSTQLARHLGELAQGMVFTQVVPSPWDRKTALTRAYQVDFKAVFKDQDFSYGSLEGYLTTRALAEALRRAGRELSRPAFLRGMANAQIDIEGFKLAYKTGDHAGSTFVDTAIVVPDGRFRH